MATAKPQIKNHFSPSEKVVSYNGGEDRKPAKQEFKEDADLNSIMKKFQRTKTMDHAIIHGGYYGAYSGAELQDALNVTTNAQQMFDALPSSIRNKFENKPSAFLDYVQDPNNATEAQELGISLAPEAATIAANLAAEAAATGEPVAQEAPPEPSGEPA